MKHCEWCAARFAPRIRTQRFCSKSCASCWQYKDKPKRVHRWGPRPPVDPAHRKLRAQLLPHAIGTPCPDCGRIMDQTAELDHIIPRSQGGTSTRDNVRITCRACNRRRGSQLGGRVAHRAHRAGRPQAVWRSSNW